MSMATMISTGIAVSVDSLNWLMQYLVVGWIVSFGLFTVWTIYCLKIGVTYGTQNHGQMYKLHRKKEPRLFMFLIVFYLLMGVTGFVSILFTALSN
jgi:hypothetical protein